MSGCLRIIGIVLLICLVITILPVALGVAAAVGAVIGCFKLYEYFYFKGEKFQTIKANTEAYVKDCNELNNHVHELESTPVPGAASRPLGRADYHDASSWNYKREKLKLQSNATNVYNCSRTVCDNARKNPMQYVCKYFNIKAEESSLEAFEKLANNYSAAIDGKKDLEAKKQELTSGIKVPKPIRKFDMKTFEKKLGFEPVGLDEIIFPRYKFQYISSGGNASTECVVEMNMDNLEAMLNYLNGRIKWKKSVAGQRALMTPSFRKNILARDNYTCKYCGNGTAKEPHLLLEIDHIVPVSKGGLTRADNLQTLCWKCNRSKGAKIIQ